jgi:hypothetical protein
MEDWDVDGTLRKRKETETELENGVIAGGWVDE